MSKIALIGIGNPFRGDDAAGILVARELRKILSDKIRNLISIIESDGDITTLLDCFKKFEAVFIVDAVCSQKPQRRSQTGAEKIGVIYRLDGILEPLPQTQFLASSHAFGVLQAIELGRTLGVLPAYLKILGIEGQSFEMQTGTLRSECGAVAPNVKKTVSPSVNRAIDKVVGILFMDIKTRLIEGGEINARDVVNAGFDAKGSRSF